MSQMPVPTIYYHKLLQSCKEKYNYLTMHQYCLNLAIRNLEAFDYVSILKTYSGL